MTPVSEPRGRPRYAMISTWIRRDVHDPLRHFRALDLVHLYQHAIYQDTAPGELATAQRYVTPIDLYQRLCLIRPEIVQNVEPLALMTLPYLYATWLYARRHNCPIVAVSLENRPLVAKYNQPVAFALQRLLMPYFRDASLIIYLMRALAAICLPVARPPSGCSTSCTAPGA